MRIRGSHRPLLTLFAFQDVIMSVTGIMLVLMLLLSLELVSRPSQEPETTASKTAETLREQLSALRQTRDELQHSLRAAEALIQGASVNPQELREEITSVETEIQSLQAELRDLHEQQQRLDQEQQAVTARLANLQSLQTEVAALNTRAEELAEQVRAERQNSRLFFNLPPGEQRSGWLVVLSGDEIAAAPLGRSTAPLIFAHALVVDRFLEWTESLPRDSVYLLLLVRPSGVDRFRRLQPELKKRGIPHGFDVVTELQTPLHPERGAAP